MERKEHKEDSNRNMLQAYRELKDEHDALIEAYAELEVSHEALQKLCISLANLVQKMNNVLKSQFDF